MLKTKKQIAFIAGIIASGFALVFLWQGLMIKKPEIPLDVPKELITAELAYHRPSLFSGMHASVFQAVLAGDLLRNKVTTGSGLIAYAEKPVNLRFYFPRRLKVLNGYWQGVRAFVNILEPVKIDLVGQPGYLDRDWGERIPSTGLKEISPFFDISLPIDANFRHQKIKIIAKMEIFYPIIDEHGFHNETTVLTQEFELLVVSPEELALRLEYRKWQNRIRNIAGKVFPLSFFGICSLVYAFRIQRYSGPNIEKTRFRAINGDNNAIRELICLISEKNDILRTHIFKDLAFIFYQTISAGEVIIEIGKMEDYHLKEKFVEYLLASPDYISVNHQTIVENMLKHLIPVSVVPIVNQQKKWGQDERCFPGLIVLGTVKSSPAIEALFKFIRKRVNYQTLVSRDTLLLVAEALHKQGETVLIQQILLEKLSNAKDFWSMVASVRALVAIEWQAIGIVDEIKVRYLLILMILNLHYPEELYHSPYNPGQEALFNPLKVMEKALQLREAILVIGKDNIVNLQNIRTFFNEGTPELAEIKCLVIELQHCKHPRTAE